MKWIILLTVITVWIAGLEARQKPLVVCPPPPNPSKEYLAELKDRGVFCGRGYNISAGDCFNYCRVHKGNITLQTCPGGLQFSVEKGKCEDEDYVNCPNSRCPTVDPPYPVYLRATSCRQFYECSNGNAIRMDCPGLLNWSIQSNVCADPPTDCIDLPEPDDQ